MTPAPTTASFFGTLSKSSAPQLSTMFLPSKGMHFSSVGIEPRRQHDVFRAQRFLLAVVRGEFHLAAGEQLAVALQRGDAGALEQHGDALVLALTMPVLRFCICATSNSTPLTLMPWTPSSSLVL